MDYVAGLDVSLETASICIVNAAGDICLEKKVEAEPAAIIAVLKYFGRPVKRIGLEAGPTSSWLSSELCSAGYAAICLECRHVKAGLSAVRNKTDCNDAGGIAQLVRLGWFRQVHVKSAEAQRMRMLLVNRQQLLTKALDLENSVRGSLKVFGSALSPGRHSRHGSVNWSGKTAAWSPSPNPCCGSGQCYSMNLSASIACVDSWLDAIPSVVG
jgi:transposase